jgi:hypothetical protein
MTWTSLGISAAMVALTAAVASQSLPGTAADVHARGVDFHNARRLDEASREYARALALDPARPPSAAERTLITRFSPRLYTVPNEFFALRDVAAVLHPTDRLIAYHLFWDDDIDFPEDNDPCDHEVAWVQYSPDGQTLERYWTYFHGRILSAGAEALSDARAHGMRPRVNAQWGKHGSLPHAWESMSIVADSNDVERRYLALETPLTLLDYNRATWQKLHTEGRRLKDHPLARRLEWPDTFGGDWHQFVAFSRLVDPVPLLDRHGMVAVSRWNSAVIDQHFLAYNFRPKTEWPIDAGSRRVTTAASVSTASSLDEFQLPTKAVFDKAMPRYPNLWFFVDAALVDSYPAAIRLIADQIRGPMRALESHGPFANPEGADFEVTLEHLQPWDAREHRSLQHAHAFHLRYYHSALARRGLERVTLPTAQGDRPFYRVAASAHYEVEHTNPNHADVESCPICGRTGDYQALRGNLVEVVHDPLGVELLLNGTIRGEVVRFHHDQQEVGGIASARERFSIQTHVFPAMTGDRNTLRIGVIVLGRR